MSQWADRGGKVLMLSGIFSLAASVAFDSGNMATALTLAAMATLSAVAFGLVVIAVFRGMKP